MSQKYYDEHTIYCDTSVATEKQLAECIKKAIIDATQILGEKTTCKFKVNLLVNKEGKYFGFGYVRVSDSRVYWMLLGRNPDGTERVEQYPDPNWTPPPDPNEGLTQEEIIEKNRNKSWAQLAEEEDKYIQPMIKNPLPPLVTIPGYEYDEEQRKHLKKLGLEENPEEDIEIPKYGYFAIQRGYASDAPPGTVRHKICARNVPDWIPKEAFKSIFSFYTSEESKKKKVKNIVKTKDGLKEIEDSYPLVNFINSKNGARIVFVTFDPATKDALFALLMTKKTHIIHPENRNLEATLVFMHAYDTNSK